jgi:hypothetical protein
MVFFKYEGEAGFLTNDHHRLVFNSKEEDMSPAVRSKIMRKTEAITHSQAVTSRVPNYSSSPNSQINTATTNLSSDRRERNKVLPKT